MLKRTKEIIFNFRKVVKAREDIQIDIEPVEIVNEYKYLGLYIDSKFSWNRQTEECYKKIRQKFYFVRQLKKFNLSSQIIYQFYDSIVLSTFRYGIQLYFYSLNAKNRAQLNRTHNAAIKIMKDKKLPEIEDIVDTIIKRKCRKIINESSHPLNFCFIRMRSGRLRHFKGSKRFLDSFVPTAIKLFNKSGL